VTQLGHLGGGIAPDYFEIFLHPELTDWAENLQKYAFKHAESHRKHKKC